MTNHLTTIEKFSTVSTKLARSRYLVLSPKLSSFLYIMNSVVFIISPSLISYYDTLVRTDKNNESSYKIRSSLVTEESRSVKGLVRMPRDQKKSHNKTFQFSFSLRKHEEAIIFMLFECSPTA